MITILRNDNNDNNNNNNNNDNNDKNNDNNNNHNNNNSYTNCVIYIGQPAPDGHSVVGRGGRKGTNGVSTNGVSANFMFLNRGTFWVLP